MSHELSTKQKIKHCSRFQFRHKNRGIRSTGGRGARRIEVKVMAKWDELIAENARQKGKTHWKANGTKWKHAATRKMRYNKKIENFME